MKEYLKKIITAKESEIADVRAKIEGSQDINEVRSLGETLQKLDDELNSAKAQIEKMEARENSDNEIKESSFNPLATYGIGGVKPEKRATGTDSPEYRSAFMNLVLKNKPIPAELRASANTLTTDVASVIPAELVNRIIGRAEKCGMILPLVTRTSYAAGIVIPTSSVKPAASWVAEGATSDRQKKTTGKIVFSYFKLRCEISMSMEVGTMALSAFESAFVTNVANAMTVAMEKSILAGSGEGQPTGILAGTPLSDQIITIADKTNKVPTYKELIKAEAAVPVEFEGSAKWFMTKKQFMNFVSMTDSNGQPIARVDYGIEGKPSRMLLGREVVVHPYAEEMGSYVAGIFDFRDYALNTIYDMGIQKKQDWDTEDLLTKAVMSVDGKPTSLDSLVVMKPAS